MHYKTLKTSPSLKRYKKLHKEYNKKCRQAKLKAEKDFLAHLDQISSVSKMYKSVNNTEIPISVMKKSNSEETKPGTETLKHLYDTHFPKHTPHQFTRYDNSKTVKLDDLWNIHKDTVSLEKVRRALKGFNSKKSPGPDDFKPIIFKHFTKTPIDTYYANIQSLFSLGIHTYPLERYTSYLYTQT